MTQRLREDSVVLLTGATGFIGSHLAEHLIKQGYRVRCIVRPETVKPKWIDGLPLEIVRASLTDRTALHTTTAGVRTIIHVAGVTKAKRHEDFRRGNVDTTASLLDVARRIPDLKRFCCISSLTVSGPSPSGRLVTEAEPANPITAYARAKWEAEELCHAAARELPVTVIRPPIVYGPRDHDVLEMFRWVRYGLHPVIGSPDKTLSVVHVQDLVRGIALAAFDHRGVGRTYNIANEMPYRYDELIRLIAEVVGRRPLRFPFPTPLLYVVAGLVEAISILGPSPAVLSIDKARDMVQPHWVSDPGLIHRELGFRSSIGITEGFRETYHWYRDQGWL